jgi:23S rRNA pseudouridine2605 synthase
MLHKPKGYVVTRLKRPDSENSPGTQTVYALLPAEFHDQGWVPVGRLDKDSSGLLLFTREGPLVYRLQTPGNHQKVYEVWVKGILAQEHLRHLLDGVETPLGLLKAAKVEVLGQVGPNSLIRMILEGGRNRQIRRMFACMRDMKKNKYFKVLELTRMKIGSVELDVQPGEWRFLSGGETESLLKNLPDLSETKANTGKY